MIDVVERMSIEEAASRDLREHWDYLRLRIRACPRLCILTDFDGTLVALEPHPDLPRLQGNVRRAMDELRRLGRVTLGVVSGRALTDLMSRVNLPGIWYVGNHGFEIRDPRGEERLFYEPDDVTFLAGVRDELSRELEAIPGVFLEHKGPVLAVHHRGVDPEKVADVERGFIRIMDRNRTRLMLSRGHAVLEARVRGAVNKGRAVGHIRRTLAAGTFILYFGDDLTDRDAFRELRGIGISVEIGGGISSIADFTLPDPAAVLEVLLQIRSEVEAKR